MEPTPTVPEGPSWGEVSNESIAVVRGFMQGQQFPQMRRPVTFGQDYDFPSSPADLTLTVLGSLQLMITGYYTECLRVLGTADAELGLLKGPFDIKLGLEQQRLQDARGTGKGSRVLKENLTAMAIEGNEGLKAAYILVLQKEAILKVLTAQRDIYHEHLLRLSREQTRRELEAHLG